MDSAPPRKFLLGKAKKRRTLFVTRTIFRMKIFLAKWPCLISILWWLLKLLNLIDPRTADVELYRSQEKNTEVGELVHTPQCAWSGRRQSKAYNRWNFIPKQQNNRLSDSSVYSSKCKVSHAIEILLTQSMQWCWRW